MIWVGKNLAEQGIICCIYNARDVDMVWNAITLAYAAADEGCYSLYKHKTHTISPHGTIFPPRGRSRAAHRKHTIFRKALQNCLGVAYLDKPVWWTVFEIMEALSSTVDLRKPYFWPPSWIAKTITTNMCNAVSWGVFFTFISTRFLQILR